MIGKAECPTPAPYETSSSEPIITAKYDEEDHEEHQQHRPDVADRQACDGQSPAVVTAPFDL